MAEVKKLEKQKHFVLVHGACHGAWSWYKVKPLLESAGHRVTLLDLAASGINSRAIKDVVTFYEYTQPLLNFLAALPPDDKVILVGHSLGGINLALAMESFPKKIAVAVFLTAFMPDTDHRPSFVLDQYNERTPLEAWLDTQFSPLEASNPYHISMFFGPKFLSTKLYHRCNVQDVELAKTLVRPSSLYMYDLSNTKNFSSERYGSVERVYIVCPEDKGIPREFQQWMIENSPVQRVMEIKDADHMAMLSTPQQLFNCLSEI